MSDYFDIIIVGAGLSGIGMAVHLAQQCPDKSYAILEGRAASGGTWDLFRYPGVRSDSDMHTLGYRFKPWRAAKAIADGPSILQYVRETAAEYDVERHIRYEHRVEAAAWDSDAAAWTLTFTQGSDEAPLTLRCNMLLMCAGYYSYARGHEPTFPGRDRFQGAIVHPQFWPEDLDYTDKRVVVIGSGATAMTLVPAMAPNVAHITMLQRSPTYVISRPDTDGVANFLRRVLPERLAYAITRWKNTLLQQLLYRRTRTHPDQIRKQLLDAVRQALGPDYDVEKHFTPRYDPWDQRLCLVPNSDLFQAIRSGKASVATDHIETFTEDGILLKSGASLAADIIITATGLELIVLGGVAFTVDGRPIDFARTFTYKGMMYSDVPNLVSTFGYINASWTLRADLIADFVCRLINHMDAAGVHSCTPTLKPAEANMDVRPWVTDFSAGYMQRAMHKLPRQGDRYPWVNVQNYRREKKTIGRAPIDDGWLRFGRRRSAKATNSTTNGTNGTHLR